MARNRRPERDRRQDRRADRRADRRERDRRADRRGRRGGQGKVTELKESGRFPQEQAPAGAQAGAPTDYPDEAAAFSTGPGEAAQYHYTRQDLYAEQFAQEQIAADQAQSAGTRAVPGPGQVGVSSA
jgi:hypothetical protein